MQYKLTNSLAGTIIMTDDSGIVSFVPADSANKDYAKYQAWLSQGNTPQPADE